jgi:hypothetical protein
MEISVEDFHSHLLERVLDLLWRQWSTLGTYTTTPAYEAAVIDPEALVCATTWFARYSPRLFDEAMDWLGINDGLISIDRLKSIAGLFSGDTRAALGATLDYLWEIKGRTKFRGKSTRWEKERPKRKETLFRSWPAKGEPLGGNGDEVFLRWGFERGPVELRGMTSSPNLENAANLRFVLRDLFGLGVRAEVATFLIVVGRGNSSQVAKAVTQNQRAVYTVLDDFARGGFAHKREAGREIVFTIDKERWSRFIELKGDARFIQWADVFSALQEILVDRIENEKAYDSPYLASSRLREISPPIIRKLANAGAMSPIPDPRKFPGEEFNVAFLGYIEKTANEFFAQE